MQILTESSVSWFQARSPWLAQHDKPAISPSSPALISGSCVLCDQRLTSITDAWAAQFVAAMDLGCVERLLAVPACS